LRGKPADHFSKHQLAREISLTSTIGALFEIETLQLEASRVVESNEALHQPNIRSERVSSDYDVADDNCCPRVNKNVISRCEQRKHRTAANLEAFEAPQ
jgi:hypothetical protein